VREETHAWRKRWKLLGNDGESRRRINARSWTSDGTGYESSL
jgi:hypothetical protein